MTQIDWPPTIGIDTNVLVRLALQDDPDQAARAQDFVLEKTTKRSLFVSSYAVLELAWLLQRALK